NFQRSHLLDAAAPNPSVETLLHAFLPAKFIDHTHAAAVLSLIDQPNGRQLAEEVYDGSMGFVPYAIPGFGLAKLAARVFEANPDVAGLILDKHGIFTFAETAREAYERMIAMVSRAEARLAKGRRNVFAAASLPARLATQAEVAPLIRGAPARQRRRAQALPSQLPQQCRGVGLRQRRRPHPLQPAWRRHPRPYHPHQEPAAARAGPRGRQARGLCARPRPRRGGLRRCLRRHL